MRGGYRRRPIQRAEKILGQMAAELGAFVFNNETAGGVEPEAGHATLT